MSFLTTGVGSGLGWNFSICFLGFGLISGLGAGRWIGLATGSGLGWRAAKDTRGFRGIAGLGESFLLTDNAWRSIITDRLTSGLDRSP